MYTYKANLLRVIDGDTIEVMIDLGLSVYKKKRLDLLVLILQKSLDPLVMLKKHMVLKLKSL